MWGPAPPRPLPSWGLPLDHPHPLFLAPSLPSDTLGVGAQAPAAGTSLVLALAGKGRGPGPPDPNAGAAASSGHLCSHRADEETEAGGGAVGQRLCRAGAKPVCWLPQPCSLGSPGSLAPTLV